MPGSASLKSVQYLDAGAPAEGTTITTFDQGLITQSITSPDKVPVKFLNYAWIGVAYAADLLSDVNKKETFALLTAGAMIGRPFIAPGAVPADRIAALQKAFEATMKDPEFLAEAEKQQLPILPMAAAEIEATIKKLYLTSPDIVAAAKVITGN